MPKKYLLLLFLFLLSFEIKAQYDTLKTFELQQVTVTGTKFEKLIRTLTPSYTIISENSINQNIKSALFSSISGKAPGLFVTENGFSGFGIGSNASGRISIRGINGIQQNLIVVDGRPEFAGIFGHPLADVYHSSEIAAVDIIRGPASVLYGTNAMGGVINITTKKSQVDGLKLFADINYGSYNTYKINGTVDYRKNSFNNTFIISRDFSNDNRPSSNSSSISGVYNAEYIFNPSWSINFNTYVNSSRVYNPGPVFNPYPDNSVWTNVTRVNSSLRVKNKFNNSEGTFLFYFNNGVHDVYDGFHSNDNILGISLIESFEFFENNIISFGAEFKNYGGKARSNIQLIDKKVSEKSIYAIFSYNIFKNLFVNGGLRLNNHSVYGSLLIPQFSLNYNLNNRTSFNFTIAEGFRSPTLNELFLFGANIDLKPEKLWNYELGFKSYFFAERLLLKGAFFLMEGKDFIRMIGIYPDIKNQNISSLTNRGVEIEAEYFITKDFSLKGNYSYLKSSTKLLSSPEMQAFVEMNYTYKIFTFNANINGIKNLYTSLKTNTSDEKKQSYALFNCAVWLDLLKEMKLYIKLDNLLNKGYEIIDGYPMPGRTIIAGIKISGAL